MNVFVVLTREWEDTYFHSTWGSLEQAVEAAKSEVSGDGPHSAYVYQTTLDDGNSNKLVRRVDRTDNDDDTTNVVVSER